MGSQVILSEDLLEVAVHEGHVATCLRRRLLAWYQDERIVNARLQMGNIMQKISISWPESGEGSLWPVNDSMQHIVNKCLIPVSGAEELR